MAGFPTRTSVKVIPQVKTAGLNNLRRFVLCPDPNSVALLIQIRPPRKMTALVKVANTNMTEFIESKPTGHKESQAEGELLVQNDHKTANIVNVAVIFRDKFAMLRRFFGRSA
jgi:hypothetical protein